jgi:hypothetical protein
MILFTFDADTDSRASYIIWTCTISFAELVQTKIGSGFRICKFLVSQYQHPKSYVLDLKIALAISA